MTDDESGLLLDAQRGQVDAFGRFYDNHSAALLRWLTRRTAAADVASDLCAEVFASALASLDSYRSELGTPSAWLYGIAHNKVRHWLEKERVGRDARDRLGIYVELPHADDLDLVELRTDIERLLGPLEAALGRLSDGIRLAVLLRVVDGLPYKDIGLRIGCSEGAARVRVSRGLSQLLDDLESDPELI